MAPESLAEKHQFIFREALHAFSSTKKMGGQEFCDRYQEQLETELGEMWLSFGKHNQVSGFTLNSLNISVTYPLYMILNYYGNHTRT